MPFGWNSFLIRPFKSRGDQTTAPHCVPLWDRQRWKMHQPTSRSNLLNKSTMEELSALHFRLKEGCVTISENIYLPDMIAVCQHREQMNNHVISTSGWSTATWLNITARSFVPFEKFLDISSVIVNGLHLYSVFIVFSKNHQNSNDFKTQIW